jgi:hypothetical protein
MSFDIDTGRLTIGVVWDALESVYGADRLGLILLAPLWQEIGVTQPFAILLAACTEHLDGEGQANRDTELTPDEALALVRAVENAMETQLRAIAERQ